MATVLYDGRFCCIWRDPEGVLRVRAVGRGDRHRKTPPPVEEGKTNPYPYSIAGFDGSARRGDS